MELRRAVRAVLLARLADPSVSVSDPAVALLRNAAQARLDYIVASDASAADKSRAAGLLGVIGLARLVSETQDRVAALSSTVANLQLAIELDPSNHDAKYNLELALQRGARHPAHGRRRRPEPVTGRKRLERRRRRRPGQRLLAGGMSLTILTPLGALLASGIVVPLVALLRARRKAVRVRDVLGVEQPRRRAVAAAARRARARRGAPRPRGCAARVRVDTRPNRADGCRGVRRRRRLAVDAGAAGHRLASAARACAGRGDVGPRLSSRHPRRGRHAHRPRAPAPLSEHRPGGVRGDAPALDRHREAAAAELVRDRRDIAERARDAPRASLLHAEVDRTARDRPHRRREPAGVERPPRRPASGATRRSR